MATKKYTGKKIIQRKALLLKVALTAIFVALAVAIEYLTKSIPHVEFPQGGTLSLTCLPLFYSALVSGPVWGIVGGALYGVFNFLIDGAAFSWGSLLFDYLIAFALTGLAGLFTKPFYRGKAWAFVLGAIVGMTGRYLSHCVSGAVFFADYAPEGVSAIYYSFILYNAPYCYGSLALDLIVGLAVFPALNKLLDNSGFDPLWPMQKRFFAKDASALLIQAFLDGKNENKAKLLSAILQQNIVSLNSVDSLLHCDFKNMSSEELLALKEVYSSCAKDLSGEQRALMKGVFKH